MALYKGFSTIDFSSGNISKGSFPSNSIKDQYTLTVSPITKKVILEYTGNNTFKLVDIALIERNILNHIFTRIGSRIMMPKWGSKIPELLFENLNDDTIELCRSELERIINYDPRVKLLNLSITPLYDMNTLTASISLKYIELNMTKNMNLNLEFSA
jgi:phage baseplate assembly protein W